MTRFSDTTRKKIVKQHIQDGRTIMSLAAEYGVSSASVSNWVRAYREECQTDDNVNPNLNSWRKSEDFDSRNWNLKRKMIF